MNANSNARQTSTSVCVSVPIWKILIFGLFFMPNPDIRILSGFFVQVRIGPRPPILFSNIISDKVTPAMSAY